MTAAPPSPPRALNHVSVTTRDIERALTFYADLLGLPLLGRGETTSVQLAQIIGLGAAVHLRWAELDLGAGQFLELFEYVVPEGAVLRQRTSDAGSVHFALAVEAIEPLWRRLVDAEVVVRSPPVRLVDGEWAGAQALYALDPDGVTVELIEFPRAVA